MATAVTELPAGGDLASALAAVSIGESAAQELLLPPQQPVYVVMVAAGLEALAAAELHERLGVHAIRIGQPPSSDLWSKDATLSGAQQASA